LSPIIPVPSHHGNPTLPSLQIHLDYVRLDIHNLPIAFLDDIFHALFLTPE
jgi:hypothetical protein